MCIFVDLHALFVYLSRIYHLYCGALSISATSISATSKCSTESPLCLKVKYWFKIKTISPFYLSVHFELFMLYHNNMLLGELSQCVLIYVRSIVHVCLV